VVRSISVLGRKSHSHKHDSIQRLNTIDYRPLTNCVLDFTTGSAILCKGKTPYPNKHSLDDTDDNDDDDVNLGLSGLFRSG